MRFSPFLAALLVGAAAHAGESRTVYVRAQIERAVSGTVTIASQLEPLLDLPAPDCADLEFNCVREQQYGQLYRLEFVLNELNRSPDGVVDSDQDSAGEIFIAADMDKSQELTFDEAVDVASSLLNGDSFRHAYAGWSFGTPPLQQQGLVGSSGQSAWLCLVHGQTEREYRFTPQFDGEQVIGMVTGPAGPAVTGKACESLRAARRLEGGRSLTTPYDIGSLVRTEIDVSSDWYPGDTGLDALQALPDEMQYKKTRVDHEGSGSSMGVDDGIFTMDRTGNGVRQRLRLGAFDVEPPRPQSSAWVTRWTITTLRESFGAGANEELIDRQELWIVALPIPDPLADEETPASQDPGDAALDGVVGTLDRAARPDIEVVAQAFQQDVTGAMEGDWLVVYCPSRGSPEYSIAKFFARAAMNNGDDVCDAVHRLYAAP